MSDINNKLKSAFGNNIIKKDKMISIAERKDSSTGIVHRIEMQKVMTELRTDNFRIRYYHNDKFKSSKYYYFFILAMINFLIMRSRWKLKKIDKLADVL